jgi:calcineurin-like phosphoesterase family protein
MGNIYVISDLHLDHNNLAIHRGFCNSDEHDSHIINNWNNTVKKGDTVYILGDICMEKKEGYKILSTLKGYKKVILGNHDMPQHVPELLKYVNWVGGVYRYKKVAWLTHFPIHPTELYDKINIHGHIHEKNIEDDRYINVSCEQINYTPQLLNSILDK